MSCNDGALEFDVDTGDMLLLPHAGFEWIVGGHQVGAQWEEKEPGTLRHLGGPSPVHGNDSSLRLWFALNRDNNEMVVVLTMSVKSRTKSKARPRSFFLLVPAEDLRISSAIQDFQPIPLDLVPEALFERPVDPVSANATRILHVSFTLGHERTCGVVMNTRPYSGKLRGTPLALLDGLKSLSEARRFDLYLKFSSYAQVGLHQLSQNMEQNVAFFTPHFNLKDMYAGGWDGDFDLWEAQGWHNTQDTPSRKRKACSPLVEEEHIRAPPAYNERGIPAPPAYASSTSLPEILQIPRAKQPQSDPPLQPTTHKHPLQTTTSSSIICDSIAPNIPNTPHSPYPIMFSDTMSENSTSASAVPSQLLPTLFPAVDPSSLIHVYDREMGIWLLTAWTLIPNIHFLLIQELLAVAAAVSDKNESTYRIARMKCAKKLATCVADQIQQQTDPSNVSEETRLERLRKEILVSEPDGCISWLFMLRTEGDLGFMDLLGKLERRKRIALSVIDDKEGFKESVAGFMVVRAAVVLQGLCMEGSRVLQRLKEEGIGGDVERDVARFASWSGGLSA